jgi:hypothetical protein
MIEDTLTDAAGSGLGRDDVEELAFRNVMDSMSRHELTLAYIATMSDEELVQWATDEEGNFPD